jgi:ABC-type transport system involved in Fe-S cluster assembly fused permease/ATPase subunit
MNAFIGIGLLTFVVYSLMIDFTFCKIYLVFLIAYIILTQLGTLSRFNNKRKKCNIATWNGNKSI